MLICSFLFGGLRFQLCSVIAPFSTFSPTFVSLLLKSHKHRLLHHCSSATLQSVATFTLKRWRREYRRSLLKGTSMWSSLAASMTHSGRAEVYFCFFFNKCAARFWPAKVLFWKKKVLIFVSVRSSSGITPWTPSFDIYRIPNILPKLAPIWHFSISFLKNNFDVQIIYTGCETLFILDFFPRPWCTSKERSNSVKVWCHQVQILRCRVL